MNDEDNDDRSMIMLGRVILAAVLVYSLTAIAIFWWLRDTQ